jgi:hypothetical protein
VAAVSFAIASALPLVTHPPKLNPTYAAKIAPPASLHKTKLNLLRVHQAPPSGPNFEHADSTHRSDDRSKNLNTVLPQSTLDKPDNKDGDSLHKHCSGDL